MKNVIAYVLMGLGLIAVALSYKPVRDAANLALPSNFPEMYLIILGVVLAGVGVFMIVSKSRGHSNNVSEVPIYHGKDVVGFRRIKK